MAFGVRRFGALVYESDWGRKWDATKDEAEGTTKANRGRRTPFDEGNEKKRVTEIASQASRDLIGGELCGLYGCKSESLTGIPSRYDQDRDGERTWERAKAEEKEETSGRTSPGIFEAIPVKANVGCMRWMD